MGVMCSAYLGMSLDGFIAGPNGELDWLEQVDVIDGEDFGYVAFMGSVDALIMGRRTYEIVANMPIPWPYTLPVVVMSSSVTAIPGEIAPLEVFAGTPAEMVQEARNRGWSKLYIDGGLLVSSFVNERLLDELIVSVLPVALGSGTALFAGLDGHHWLKHEETTTFSNGMVQLRYTKKS